nr:PREDICTED: GTP-binding protein Rit2 [Equus przewalskii]
MEVENEASCSPSSASGGSREYKVVMLGAGGVGKSAMTMQFISHQFPDYHDPTIEDAYKTQVRIDNEPAYLDILDTAGQAEFTAMREQYMRGGEGFIICYSVTDRQSFQEAAKFKELIFQVRHTYEIPLVLVGNKIDLEQFRQGGFISLPLKEVIAERVQLTSYPRILRGMRTDPSWFLERRLNVNSKERNVEGQGTCPHGLEPEES